jgi:hypothetical protein
MKLRLIAFGWLSLLAVANIATSAEWGTLKGQFTVEGIPPVVDDSLQVGPKGELANVVIWVRTKDVAVHPDYAKAAKAEAKLEYQKGKLVPRVWVMQVGQPSKIKNSDQVEHNIVGHLTLNDAFNIHLTVNAEQSLKPFGNLEHVPVDLGDTIYPPIRGWLLVRPNPYFAVSDTDGKFEIKNLPAGTPLEFPVWHERPEYIKKITTGAPPGWKDRGRFTMELQPGENDLKSIALDAKQF